MLIDLTEDLFSHQPLGSTQNFCQGWMEEVRIALLSTNNL